MPTQDSVCASPHYLQCDRPPALRDRGYGMARLPNGLIHEDLRPGTLINVLPTYAVTATDFSSAAWLVYPSRTYVPLKVRVFIEFLKQSIPDLVTT